MESIPPPSVAVGIGEKSAQSGGGKPKGRKKKKKKKKKKDQQGTKRKAGVEGSSQDGKSQVTKSAESQEKKPKLGISSRKPSDHTFKPLGASSSNDDSINNKKRVVKGRPFTVSVAIPGSIVSNAQSPELRTYLVGQIARAITIFEVDEVVIFSEDGSTKSLEGEFKGSTKRSDPNVFMARVLQYLETPQYLRKELFPMHPDLKFAGLLNPLDAPHHVRIDTVSKYREGVVARRPTKPGAGAWVNVGLRQCALVPHQIPARTRVTVKLPEPGPGGKLPKTLRGTAVAPTKPRTEDGLYWGYTTRLAPGLAGVLQQCPYKGGYDLTIGTSERGIDAASKGFEMPRFKHLLLVFGGLGGLEDAIEGDERLRETDPNGVFSLYINSCTNQGSRTIRTEEAVPITLSLLRPHILANIRHFEK